MKRRKRIFKIWRRIIISVAAFMAFVPASAATRASISDADWVSLNALAGVDYEIHVIVIEKNVFYIGGIFTLAGDKKVNNIVQWDGKQWKPLGSGFPNGSVLAMAFDTAGNLFAGGRFDTADNKPIKNIAKWDGVHWSPLGSGVRHSTAINKVEAIVFDKHGNLYAGGCFDTAGDKAVDNIAKWNGTNWEPLIADTVGRGQQNWTRVGAMAVSNSGQLIVGGSLIYSNTLSEPLRVWNGAFWEKLGKGIGSGFVSAIAFDDMGNMYAGGGFDSAGGLSAKNIARWTGTAWESLGNGTDRTIFSLAWDGRRKTLFAAGNFRRAGGVLANGMAQWTDGEWSSCGKGTDTVATVYSQTIDDQGDLIAAGNFRTMDGEKYPNIARWNGSRWRGLCPAITGQVNAIVCGNDGAPYIAGSFSSNGWSSVNNIARWNGSSWDPLGTGTNGPITCMAFDRSGALVAGGAFSKAGDAQADNIARWDGTSWIPLGPGTDGPVAAVCADGQGKLFAGGGFDSAGNVPCRGVARWNGGVWEPLGSGVWLRTGETVINPLAGRVNALAFDKTGDLYVGGSFDTAGGVLARNVARWSGNAWYPVGQDIGNSVASLAFDAKGILYAGGQFSNDRLQITGIAQWDGKAWSAVGGRVYSSLVFFPTFSFSALAFDDNGDLYAGGYFDSIGGVYAHDIARWDGKMWSPLAGGIGRAWQASGIWSYPDFIFSLTAADSFLFVGGYFVPAGDKTSPAIAKVNIHANGSSVGPDIRRVSTRNSIWYRQLHSTLFIINASRHTSIEVYTLTGRCVRRGAGESAIDISGVSRQPVLVRIFRGKNILSTGMVMVH